MMAVTGDLISHIFRDISLRSFNNFAVKFFYFFALNAAHVIMMSMRINLKDISILLSVTD